MESNYYKDGYIPYLKANQDERRERGRAREEGGDSKSNHFLCMCELCIFSVMCMYQA